MEDQVSCQFCHVAVRTTDYFCWNCGKNLRPKPLSTSFLSQLWIYVGSIVLPPMGIIWGIRYLRQQDQTSKIVGIVAIVLTIAIIAITIQQAFSLMNIIQKQLGTQTSGLMGF